MWIIYLRFKSLGCKCGNVIRTSNLKLSISHFPFLTHLTVPPPFGKQIKANLKQISPAGYSIGDRGSDWSPSTCVRVGGRGDVDNPHSVANPNSTESPNVLPPNISESRIGKAFPRHLLCGDAFRSAHTSLFQLAYSSPSRQCV